MFQKISLKSLARIPRPRAREEEEAEDEKRAMLGFFLLFYWDGNFGGD
jgi:hypothetical protein